MQGIDPYISPWSLESIHLFFLTIRFRSCQFQYRLSVLIIYSQVKIPNFKRLLIKIYINKLHCKY